MNIGLATEGLKPEAGASDLEKMSKDFGMKPGNELDSPVGKLEGVGDKNLDKVYNPDSTYKNLDMPINMYELNAKDAPAEGLNETEKQEVKEETGWPDSVLDSCRSVDEAEIYEKAGLEPSNIEGRDCLIRTDIDYDMEVDGETNLDRMKEGKCPISADGQKIELHHIGQNPDAPLAELTTEEHRGEGNDMILHDKTEESKIDRAKFRGEREAYWMARAEQVEQSRNKEQE